MIKQTFYNLSETKRKELINIAKKEFANHSIYEATVANIVNEFGIARSSFYNYFDNINDLYYYILKEYKNSIKNKLIMEVEKNDGDIFKSVIDVFNYIIDGYDNQIDRDILKNVFVSSNSFAQNYVIPHPNKEEVQKDMDKIIKKLDTSNLKISKEEDMFALISLFFDIIVQGIICFFTNKIPVKEIKKVFNKKMNMIKYGIYKEDN